MSTTSGERSWCVVVPHHPRGARLARHRLAVELAGIVAPEVLADVVAVLAELVGNAVRHAEPLPGAVVRVAWRVRPAGEFPLVQVRVTDGGAPAPPTLRHADPTAADGRGLQIVSALASRWGVERDGLGQSVWAEFAAPSGMAQPAASAVQPVTSAGVQPAASAVGEPAVPAADRTATPVAGQPDLVPAP